MKTEALKKVYWKVVMLITAFFWGSSAVFLLSGAGDSGLRVLVFVIFFVSFINLSLYTRSIYQGLRRAASLFGGQSEPGQKPGGPKGGGGGGEAKAGDKPNGGQGDGPKPGGGENKPA